MGFVLDTSFLIDLLKGRAAALDVAARLQGGGEVGFLPTPALYEVLEGLLSDRSRKEAAAFRALASDFAVLAFDEEAARQAAELQSELRRSGTPLADVDVMVAAIARTHAQRLVTRDRVLREAAELLGLVVETY